MTIKVLEKRITEHKAVMKGAVNQRVHDVSSKYQVGTQRKQPRILRYKNLPGLEEKHTEQMENVNWEMTHREYHDKRDHLTNGALSLLHETQPRWLRLFAVDRAQFQDDLNINDKNKC